MNTRVRNNIRQHLKRYPYSHNVVVRVNGLFNGNPVRVVKAGRDFLTFMHRDGRLELVPYELIGSFDVSYN